MGKLSTPDWIREGFDSKADWEKTHGKKTENKKGKTYRIRVCPECGSSEVGVVLGGEEGKGSRGWECKKCKAKFRQPEDKEVSEEEFLKLGE